MLTLLRAAYKAGAHTQIHCKCTRYLSQTSIMGFLKEKACMPFVCVIWTFVRSESDSASCCGRGSDHQRSSEHANAKQDLLVFVYIYMYVHIRVSKSICLRIYVSICLSVYLSVEIYAYIHILIYVLVCLFTQYIYIYICIYTYIYICMYTHEGEGGREGGRERGKNMQIVLLFWPLSLLYNYMEPVVRCSWYDWRVHLRPLPRCSMMDHGANCQYRFELCLRYNIL